MNVQKDSEKSLAEHDLSRFEDKTGNSSYASCPEVPDEEMGAAEALKQNALANQLANLNKQLAQKEQYAIVLNEQEDKLKEVRQKYEEQLEQMENHMKGEHYFFFP